MFGFWKSWLIVLAILAFSLPARAASRIEIPADRKGPLQALINAHQSTRLLYALEHKNGRRLKPSEYRHLPDMVYYLPANAKPLASRRRVSRTSTATILRRQLTEEKNTSATLRSQNAELQKRADELPKLRSDLDRTQKELDALRAANKGNIPWLWLLAVGLIGIFTTAIAYHISATRTAERKEIEIGNLKADKKIQSDRAHEAEADLEIIHAKWDNPDALRLRLAELEKSLHHSSPP